MSEQRNSLFIKGLKIKEFETDGTKLWYSLASRTLSIGRLNRSERSFQICSMNTRWLDQLAILFLSSITSDTSTFYYPDNSQHSR